MPNIKKIMRLRDGILFVSTLALSATTSLAQQPNLNNPASPAPATQSTGQFVLTFTDPRTGKQYDRYIEQETVPITRWEQEEVSLRVAVPGWVTENIKTTETRYVPYVEYQTQQRVLNRWNPFVPPQVVLEYVPVTKYQAVNQVVERPVQYQKYTLQDKKELVPKLVQTTQAVGKYVDRERPPAANVVTNNPNMIQNAAELAMANRNNQGSRYATLPNDRLYGSNLASPYHYPPTQFVSTQSIVPPISNAYANTYSPFAPPLNSYATNRSLFQWPTWSNNNGPLFRQELFRQNPSTAYTQPINGAYYPTIASQAGVSGYLRPSSAPLLPQTQPAGWGNFGGINTYRDPIQAGLAPTVLR